MKSIILINAQWTMISDYYRRTYYIDKWLISNTIFNNHLWTDRTPTKSVLVYIN